MRESRRTKFGEAIHRNVAQVWNYRLNDFSGTTTTSLRMDHEITGHGKTLLTVAMSAAPTIE